MKSGRLNGATVALINGVVPLGQAAPYEAPPGKGKMALVATIIVLGAVLAIGLAATAQSR
ncbi:MAG: hypothetical protein A2Y38_06295 [Spirochaetes bacterium GWB1_59_5]|nr:MAG: hypothetical protein A2Y38_06295 [Spirochaetes bacterium GWB1_59_5]